MTGSYSSLISCHSSKANIKLLFSLLHALLISNLCSLGGFRDDKSLPSMCLATLMHGKRDTSEVVVSGANICCVTLNFSLWKGFFGPELYVTAKMMRKLGLLMAESYRRHQKYKLWKDFLLTVSFLWVPSQGIGSSYFSLYSSQPKSSLRPLCVLLLQI